MNKRQRAKAAVKKANPVQEAWNVVAEALAATEKITFFVSPDFEKDGHCFKLYELGGFNLLSKPVRR